MSLPDLDPVRGVSLARYAAVNAALAEGIALEVALSTQEIAADAWEAADDTWQERIDADLADEGALLEEYDALFIEAGDQYARRIHPLDEDVGDWLHFLRALPAQADVAAFLVTLDLEGRDLLRLHRLWAQRFEADPALRARALAILQEPPRQVSVSIPTRRPVIAAPHLPVATKDSHADPDRPPLFGPLPGRAPLPAASFEGSAPAPSPEVPLGIAAAPYRFGAHAPEPVPQVFRPEPAPAPSPVFVQAALPAPVIQAAARPSRAVELTPGGTLVMPETFEDEPPVPSNATIGVDSSAFPLHDPRLQRHDAGPGPGLTLEQHATMSAETLVGGRSRAYAKYGLQDPARAQAVEAHWSARLQTNPDDYTRWQEIYLATLQRLGVG